MKKGCDYIVFPLDVATAREAEKYVDLLKGRVGMFKVGLELFIREGAGVIKMIRKLSSAGIFLDLKLHDISATVEKAMEGVAALGVDLVTVHCSGSKKMLEAAVRGGRGKTRVLGVTLLTDHDAWDVAAAGFKDEFSADPGKLVLKRAGFARDTGCAGIVCSGREAAMIRSAFGPSFFIVTPGIRPGWSVPAGDDQERVTTPAQAVQSGSDLLVVGRPIRTAADPGGAADRIAREIDGVLDAV